MNNESTQPDTIFISSTCYDLIDLRGEVADHIKEIGLNPILSDQPETDLHVEPFRNSIETCLVNVRRSSIFVCVLSQRYGPRLGKAGFTPDVSATHLEYLEAQRCRIPTLVFVRDRLEADFNFWAKNKLIVPGDGSPALRYSWVQDPKDYGLFDIIEKHKDLIVDGDKSNWFDVFHDVRDLKRMLSKHLRQHSLRVSMLRLIDVGRVPVLTVDRSSALVSGENANASISIGLTVRNLAGVPALNVEARIVPVSLPNSAAPTGLTPIGTVPSGESRKQTLTIPMRFESADPVLKLQYSTPFGHHIVDTFFLGSKLRAIPPELRLLSRRLTGEVPYLVEGGPVLR